MTSARNSKTSQLRNNEDITTENPKYCPFIAESKTYTYIVAQKFPEFYANLMQS